MGCENCHTDIKAAHEILCQKVDSIVERVGSSREKTIPLLQALQDEFGYLPSDALNRVYETTEITRAGLLSVATFYSQFKHVPYGRHIIKVCVGTACHVKGAGAVYDAFRRELNMDEDTVTTEDGKYSVEKIACLGCCALAPVVQIDDKIYSHVQPGKVLSVLAEHDEYVNSRPKSEDEDEEGNAYVGEVRLGMENCCQVSGTAEVYQAVVKAQRELGVAVKLKPISCVGACNQVPMIDVVDKDGKITRYPYVRPNEVKEILLHHFPAASRMKRWKNSLLNQIDMLHTDETWDNILYKPEGERTGEINTFLDYQVRISTEGYGKINPLDLQEYRAHGGFEALAKVLKEGNRQQVIDDVLASGIRGRGGGGFPTGRKWQLVASAKGERKYVVCNGDEGDPGAFMDRILLESYPLRVIEGMTIAAYAVGAQKGIFYIRAEYPQAVIRITKALDMCREAGLLGENILGSDFSFDVEVFKGAGAFVCGEETALIASMEGDRGFPRQRPPYPAEQGLFACPTLINNVETLSQISYIITRGVESYRSVGTDNSKGTKVFALAGKVRHGGLIEVPMGTTIRQIVEQIGGGVEGGEKLKAVQIGGPSGGCIPAELCDAEIDFDALNRLGAIMGSGGMVVLSESDCMVDVARYFLNFTCEESCGKCTFCRVGIRRMLDILDRLCTGKGQEGDVERLEELAHAVKDAALCGLGKTAPNPVLATIKYFREEYEEHVRGICRTGTCKDMVKLVVTDECVGCTRCAKVCAAEAIEYRPYEKHKIDVDKCTMCGLCVDVCEFDAIKRISLKAE
ncbi:MAG: NAD(P)H-dependent oxidoreductase subunit E [Alistipes sp.]|nr:NAD(P)H-dependent oxidoreductase subunit E [Alistipes sp.]